MTMVRYILWLGLVLYLGLIAMTYGIFGPAYPLRIDPEAPFVSIQRLLVWLGVRTLYLILRFFRIFWDLLRDASAEVGDWFVSRGSEDVQAAYRSRFL